MRFNFFILCLILSLSSWASESITGGFVKDITPSLGFTSLSVNDLSKTSGGSSSVTSINFGLDYPFYKLTNRSFFIKASIPVISNSGTGLYSGALGLNFFKDGLSGAYKMADGSSSITVKPRMQYYWGPHLGSGLAVYTLKTAKKSDFSFLVGAQAGVMRQLNERWGLKFDVNVDKGFGINTGVISYSASLGATYQLE